MKIVPFDPNISADQEFDVQLGGIACRVRLTWNNFSEFWFLTITREGRGLTSLKCVPSWPLFRTNRAFAPIPGDLVIMRGADFADDTILFEDLGSRWNLVYLDETELADWERYYGIR